MLIGTTGNTFIESLFVTLTLLMTVGVFGYLLSTISNWILLILLYKYYKYIIKLINLKYLGVII